MESRAGVLWPQQEQLSNANDDVVGAPIWGMGRESQGFDVLYPEAPIQMVALAA